MKIRITVQKEKKKREASKKERKRLIIGMGFGEWGLCRMDNTILSTFWRPILTASI